MGIFLVLKNLRVLITGSEGFIGKALSDQCLLSGVHVTEVVRKRPKASNSSRVPQQIIADIGPETDWKEALQGIDAVVHLAAKTEIGQNGKGARRDLFQVNVAGTEHLARCAAKAGVRRFVFISSIKVHGETSRRPLRESDEPNPASRYVVSKLEAERSLSRISASSGMELVVLRPPLVYGPGVKGGFLMLMNWIAHGRPLPLQSIKNRRSLIYIDNLVDGILTSLTHPRAAGKIFLIADPEPLSTPDLIRRLAAALAVNPRLYACPPFLLRIVCRLTGRKKELRSLTESLMADTSSIQTEIGWNAPIPLGKGLSTTADWFRSGHNGDLLFS